jgi:sporulation protein YlmC with PRC-barrel domain
MSARDVYTANGERIGELSEIVLDDAHRPVATSIATGKEHIVGAEKLRLKGSRLVINLTRPQVEAMPSGNDQRSQRIFQSLWIRDVDERHAVRSWIILSCRLPPS